MNVCVCLFELWVCCLSCVCECMCGLFELCVCARLFELCVCVFVVCV